MYNLLVAAINAGVERLPTPDITPNKDIPATTLLGPVEISNIDLANHCARNGIINEGLDREITPESINHSTGVETRYRLQELGSKTRPQVESVPELVKKVAEKMIHNHSLKPEEIDFIAVLSSYPIGVSISASIRDHIGYDTKAQDIYGACTSLSIFLAKFIQLNSQLGERANVLVVSPEHFSAKTSPRDTDALSLFSDGASAFLLRSEDFEIVLADYTYDYNEAISMPVDHRKAPEGSFCLNIPNRAPHFDMKGRAVMDYLRGPRAFSLMRDHYAQIQSMMGADASIYLISHQGSIKIINRVEKELKSAQLDVNFTSRTLKDKGNLAAGSSPAEFIALLEDEDIHLRKGDYIMIETAGAGIAVGSSVLKVLRDIS